MKDRRAEPRSTTFRKQRLSVTYNEGGARRVANASLIDFSESGLGMESNTQFAVGEMIDVAGELRAAAYSLALQGSGRVVYCRRVGNRNFRVGLMFKEVALRPLAGGKTPN